MAKCLIGLGANLGDRRQTLNRAIALLGQEPGMRVVAQSHWLATAPVGGPAGQEDFLNGAALFETSRSPEQVHATLARLEVVLGRARTERWAARQLDLDLLLYDDLVIDSPSLRVPHPSMAFRRFVLAPAAEVAPGMTHPTIGRSIAQLLDHLNTAPPYVAIAGSPAAATTWLAAKLTERFNGRMLADPAESPDVVADASPSSIFQRQIQLLAARKSLLRRADWPAGALMVSDFWWERAVAEAKSRLAEEDWPRLESAAIQAAEEIAQPKLLVVLDDAGAAGGNEVLALAQRPGRGPVLVLQAAELDRSLSELCAAIEAMQ